MAQGRLRVHIGAAAGVGTTYAMLDEGLRRRDRGADVVLAAADPRGRPQTARLLEALTGQPDPADALDVAAIIQRRPDVVLVDDLGQRNRSGAPRRQRWQDVESLLDAGLDVVATMNVQQIASLADPVRRILGTAPNDTVPDELLRRAEQIELVDITPEAIRRRLAHGNVVDPADLDLATIDLINGPAFEQLRALLMFWLADRLAAGAQGPAEARERVVVAVTDGPGSEAVIRRAARLAQRSRADLVGVHVQRPDTPTADGLVGRRVLVHAVGGSYRDIEGTDVAGALVAFATAEQATQLVLGTTAHPRRRRRGSIVDDVIRRAGTIDVHVISYLVEPGPRRRVRWFRPSWVSRRRRVSGWLAALALLAGLTTTLGIWREDVAVSTALSLYLLAVVAIAAIGGSGPALATAVLSPFLANWFLIPPYHTLRVAEAENALSLAVFVSVALIVSRFVSEAARRSMEAARLRDEAATLAALAGTGGPDPLQAITTQLHESFALDGVAVLRVDGSSATSLATAGPRPPASIEAAGFHEAIGPGVVLVASGRTLSADDHRVLRSFVLQLAKASEQHRLASLAAHAESLDRADELRTAMLRAVSHDLRTPLAGIKASVSSLRQRDIDWPESTRQEFLATIEEDTDRLTDIVTNLLDLSRLQAGALAPMIRSVALDEVVSAALENLGARADDVGLDPSFELVDVVADPALLERVVANLVGNALTWSPPDQRVLLRVQRRARDVRLHVIDHGPGIHPRDRAQVLQPFHRLDDSTSKGGLGLGLAIADGLTTAMGGHLELQDTPGGGLTAIVALPGGTGSS